jgi:hypothetical protein
MVGQVVSNISNVDRLKSKFDSALKITALFQISSLFVRKTQESRSNDIKIYKAGQLISKFILTSNITSLVQMSRQESKSNDIKISKVGQLISKNNLAS